jgi:alkylhydroperoxidase family enzyme
MTPERIAPLRESTKSCDTVLAITEAVMGFVPNSMMIMARDPELLAAFAELSATIVVRPGRIDAGLKALIMYMVSRTAGCQYCASSRSPSKPRV